MDKINYKKASTYYLVGNMFNKGMSFFTVPIFTRILSTSDYGIVTTYNSWITILSMITGFAVYMGIRAAFIDYGNQIDDFMSVTTTFTIGCGGIICLIVGLGSLLIKINFSITLVVLCAVQGLAAAMIQNYSMYLMMRYRYKARTALMIFPNLISVVLSIFAILFIVRTDFYIGRIIPTAIVTIAFGLYTVYRVYSKSYMFYNISYLKYALTISAPLVLHGIALNLLSQSDRTMITWLADSAQTGIYSLVYNFSMIASVITTSLEGVWVPWFMCKLQERKILDINILAKDYINLMTYTMIGVVLSGPEIVKILASEKYWEGISIIPPLVLTNYIIFAYTFYVNIEHFHKKTPYITINTVIAAITNIILNYVLIPKYGYVAAAYTTLVSYLLAFALHARYAKRLEPDLYPIKAFLIPLAQIFVMVIIFYIFLDMWVIRWAILSTYMIVMLYYNRKRINMFFPAIKLKIKKR